MIAEDQRERADNAFEEGYESKLGFLNNPYPDGSVESRRWVDGHVQAIIDARCK